MKSRYGFLISGAIAVMCCGAPCMLQGRTMRGDYDFTGRVNVDNEFRLKGAEVTATAAELNAMDGVTATVTELNQLDADGNGITTCPAFSNATCKIYCSNLVVVAGGTIDFPADSLQGADIGACSLPSDVVATAASNATGTAYWQAVHVGSYRAMAGPNNTANYRWVVGSCTNNETISISPAFATGCTPFPLFTWTDTIGAATTNAFISATTCASNQVVVASPTSSATNMRYAILGYD